MSTPEPQPTVIEQLEQCVAERDADGLLTCLDSLPSREINHTISLLGADDLSELLALLPPERAAMLVDQIPEARASEVIQDLEPEAAAAILHELPSDEQADLIGAMEASEAEAVLEALPAEEARDARDLIRYAPDVAGGLMVKEFLAFSEHLTVQQVIDDFRHNAETYRDYVVQYAFVTDARGRLLGVLRLRDLLLAPPRRSVRDVMLPDPLTVVTTTTLDELRTVFDQNPFFGVPVVDEAGRLAGVVRRSAIEEALADRSDNDYLKTQGIVGGEELRSMPLWLRSRRRLGWLSINIVLNIIAASVIALYQDTLTAVIALAVFLPIISDMSGCSGNQAVAVSMRELSLDLVRPAEVMRVWMKELSVGLINGLALGVLVALAAWLWKGNVWLGLVVGLAMGLNTLVAVSIGGTVPLLLRRLGRDPALASGPILTTITDMCGFFLVLSLAALLLPRLMG